MSVVRRLLVEDDDGVHARERGEDLRALGFGRDRTVRPLDGPDRSIRVHADDERVAERARLLEVADVAGVQQVEDAVGEDDRLPAARPSTRRRASCDRFGTAIGSASRARQPGRLGLEARRRRRERPAVARPVDADVVRARLHAERVEQAMVVVRDSRRACGRRRRACRCPRRDRGCRSRTSPRRRRARRCGFISSMIRVGAVAADAVGVEEADAEHEIVDRLLRRAPSGGPTSGRRSGTRTTAGRAASSKRRRR